MSISPEVSTAPPEWLPRYDLNEIEMSQITSSYLESLILPEEDFVCVAVDGRHPLANVARTVECEVFQDSFGNTPDEMHDEYNAYEDSSKFHVVLDIENKHAAGVLRVITNSESGLKTINDLPDAIGVSEEDFLEWYGMNSLDKCWEVGTVAVLKGYRGSTRDHAPVSSMLYRAAIKDAERNNVTDTVTILDAAARRGLSLVGVPYKEIMGSDAFSYLGSQRSYALHGDVSDFFPSFAARAQEYYLSSLDENIGENTRRFKEQLAQIAGQLATGFGIDRYIAGE